MRARAAILAFALAFTASMSVGPGPSTAGCADGLLAIDPSRTHQAITAWEATAWAGQDGTAAFANYSARVFDLAVNDLRLNRLRVEVRSGAENAVDYWTQYQTGAINYTVWRSVRYSTVNDNADPNSIDWRGFQFSELDHTMRQVVVPMIQATRDAGVRLLINVNYVAFTAQIGAGLSYLHDDPDEYAEFVLATYLHLASNFGVVPDFWEVILEPDNVSQWRSGTVIGNAIAAAAARLRAAGFVPRFIAPSTANMGNAIPYLDAMVRVPGVLGNLTEYSYHRYGGVSMANLRAIADRAAAYGVQTAMLEHIGSGYADLHEDLTLANASAWQQFTLAAPSTVDTGGAYFLADLADPANPVVYPASRTRFLRQYFRYVEPGAVRVDAASDNASFEPVAFLNPDGRPVVVVKANGGGCFAVAGLPPGTYAASYTTASAFDRSLPEVRIGPGASVGASIPTAGVLTLYATGLNRPPVADAGPDVTAQKRRAVTLSAAGSWDPDGDPLAFSWVQTRGPAVPLGDVRGATLTFVPVESGAYGFAVTVQDGMGGSDTDAVSVAVGNAPPRIVASTPGADAVDLAAGDGITFAVDASDPDGDDLAFAWRVDGSPAGADAPFFTFVPRAGVHVVNVTVTDGESWVSREWTVSATEPPAPASGAPWWPFALLAALGFLVAAVAFRRRKAGPPRAD